jgi:hypothetical protein
LSNLQSGVDLYEVGQSTPVQTFRERFDAARNFTLDVAFLADGAYIVSGAHRGCVNIWNSQTGKHWQTLEHDGESSLGPGTRHIHQSQDAS